MNLQPPDNPEMTAEDYIAELESQLVAAQAALKTRCAYIDDLEAQLSVQKASRRVAEEELLQVKKMRDLSTEDTFKALQRAEAAEQRIRELERKLAEHQAAFVRMGYVGKVDGKEELNKLLSERSVPEDTARLDFVLANDAFIVGSKTDAGGSALQLMTQNEDEEYIVLHNHDLFFKTEREAIDAAMLSASPQPKEQI